MHQFNYSVICLDLRNFKSGQELDNFFKEVGLDLNGPSWYDAHIGNWIRGTIVNKVWLDVVTLCLVAYETSDQQMIYPQFAQYLNELKGIDKTFKYGEVKFNTRKDLTLDDILDKILVSGTNSLTDFEKSFLEQQSNQI